MNATQDLSSLGWDSTWASEYAAIEEAGIEGFPARVTRVERGLVRLLGADGPVSMPSVNLAVGDWVITDGLTFVNAMTRRTVLSRKEAGRTSEEQVLAANVEVVVIVEPIYPRPSTGRIERMTSLAWSSGAIPLLLLTKADLATGSEIEDVESLAYGIDVLGVSAENGVGMDALRNRLQPGLTFVLLGPSGAGKSTLINALIGGDALATGVVRGDGRGKHTTTHRELVVLPGLACMIDTPGIREVGLTSDDSGIDHAFADIVDLAQACRFRDCVHETEPGCAVREAVETGYLTRVRLSSYRRLLREITHQSGRRTVQERRSLRAEGKLRARTLKEINRVKGR